MHSSYLNELKNFEFFQLHHNSDYIKSNLKDLITCLSLINSFVNVSYQKINTNKQKLKSDSKNYLIEFKKSDPLYAFTKAEIKHKLKLLYDLRDNNEEAYETDFIDMRLKIDQDIKKLKKMIIAAKFEDKPFSEEKAEIIALIKKLSKNVIGTPFKLSYYMRKTVIELFMENSRKNILRQRYSFAAFSLAQISGTEIYISEYVRRYAQCNNSHIYSVYHA